jgi:hypothetical protein
LPSPAQPRADRFAAGGSTRRIVLAGFVLAWITLLAVPPTLLIRARASWLASLEDPSVQADWEGFRSDMQAHSGREGPVQRKVPRSLEPPLRVWLRDHFGLAIAAWVILAGTLGAFLGMMVVGAVTGPAPWPAPGINPHISGGGGRTGTPGRRRSLAENDASGGHHGNENDQCDPQNTQK